MLAKVVTIFFKSRYLISLDINLKYRKKAYALSTHIEKGKRSWPVSEEPVLEIRI